MATNKWGIIFLLAMLATLSTSVSGKEFVVGDDKGWTKNINYQVWAKDKEFSVGDKLIFKYPVGKHNVIPVDEAGYKMCIIPSTKPLATGQDSVTLDSPGRKFFICGIGTHCKEFEMNLYIDVKPPAARALSGEASPGGASPGGSGKEILVGDDKGWTTNFDYQAWANGKEFYVGDTLVFKYPPGEHNVVSVCIKLFNSCYVPPVAESAAYKTGCDKIYLDAPGKRYYYCGKENGKHCQAGMKIAIDVLPPPPTPTPIKGTRKLASTKNLSYN